MQAYQSLSNHALPQMALEDFLSHLRSTHTLVTHARTHIYTSHTFICSPHNIEKLPSSFACGNHTDRYTDKGNYDPAINCLWYTRQPKEMGLKVHTAQ